MSQQSRYDHKRFVAELVKSLSKFAYTSASNHHTSSNAPRSPGRPPNSPGRPPNSSVGAEHRLSSSAERHY